MRILDSLFKARHRLTYRHIDFQGMGVGVHVCLHKYKRRAQGLVLIMPENGMPVSSTGPSEQCFTFAGKLIEMSKHQLLTSAVAMQIYLNNTHEGLEPTLWVENIATSHRYVNSA